MDRKEAYAKIKEYNLQNKVKEVFDDNYTRISTDKLQDIIADYLASKDKPACKPACDNSPTEVEDGYRAACLAFVGILKDSGLLDELLGQL